MENNKKLNYCGVEGITAKYDGKTNKTPGDATKISVLIPITNCKVPVPVFRSDNGSISVGDVTYECKDGLYTKAILLKNKKALAERAAEMIAANDPEFKKNTKEGSKLLGSVRMPADGTLIATLFKKEDKYDIVIPSYKKKEGGSGFIVYPWSDGFKVTEFKDVVLAYALENATPFKTSEEESAE
jgi:hypothetical protein